MLRSILLCDTTSMLLQDNVCGNINLYWTDYINKGHVHQELIFIRGKRGGGFLTSLKFKLR